MRTATIRRGKIKTSDTHAPIDQAAKPDDDRPSPLPGDMSTAQLRALLKTNGVAYSGKDRKADLVFKAQQLRYGPNERKGAAVTEVEKAEARIDELAAEIISGSSSFEEVVVGLLTEPAKRGRTAPTTERVAEPEPAAIKVVDGKTRVERTAAARSEFEALKAWTEGGRTDPRPSTPNLDAITEESTHPGAKTARRAPKQPKRASHEVTVRFEVDGKPVGATQNRLSSIARVTATADSPRWPAPQLREWLVENGITDPETSAWSIELPNGRTIGAKLP